MNFWYSVLTALNNLRANKLRSVLTMLGVIIGVGSVIIMVSIVQGAQQRITAEFQRLGSSLIIIYYEPDFKARKTTARRIDGMRMNDIRAIQAQCSLVKNLSAEMPLGSGVTAKYAGRDITVSPNGVQPAYERLRNAQVAHGRFISDNDMQTWAKVCVIGDKIRGELFSDVEPIGQQIEVRGVSLTVVGVMQVRGRSMEGDVDKALYIPLTTVQKRFLGQETVGLVWAEPIAPAQLNAAMEQIWQLLMRRYDNLPGFHVDSQEAILNSINKVLAVFGLVLGSIAGLSLLVGGIGIMNIMLVSVTERTREIGIRKAIGAKRRDILLQFLIESATVSGLGGLLGIALGAGFAYTASYLSRFVPALTDPNSGMKGIAVALPIGVALGAFAFSAFVGIFFGIYPAIRAARLDPIEALRHE